MDALQTQTVNSTTAPQPNYIPGLIAVVGCDGTGKSTLTTDLVKSLQQHWQTERRYLGLLSGEDGDKIKRLPLVGVWLERRLAAKSSKTQSMKTKSPALWAAVIMYCFSLRRMANLRKVQRLAQSGVLVIVQSYAKSISDFIKFQTWQLVVQYGTPALTNNNPQQFRNVVSFSFSLDIVSGAVAIVGGIALLPFLSHSLGLDDQSFWLAALYCTLIPSMASSTPTGILRAVDRFDLIAVQQATKPFLRAAGSVVAWYFDFGFAGFVIAWYVSNLVGGTMYWWFAARELRRRNIHNAFKLNLFESARHIKGAWSFVWSTNIAHSIWSARNSCSTVLVGIVLGPAAAGLFKIAMTFFDAAGTPAGLLGKSFYPEVMRLDPRTTRPWLLGVKSGLLAGGIGILVALAVLIVGKPLISLVFGVKYLEAYDLIQVMLGAIVISMLGFPQESLLLMAGKQRAFLVAQTIASIGYIVLLFMFCHLFGVLGAAFAYFGGQCLDVALSLIPTLKAFFQRHSLLYNAAGEKS